MNFKLSAVCSVLVGMSLTSCGTLFTKSHQDVTFKGVHGTYICDSKGKYLGEIGRNGFTTIPLRKKIGAKELTAKLDGYQSRDVQVQSKFNPITVLNLLSPVAWGIDLATGKVCKFSNDVVDVTLIPLGNSGPSGNGLINEPEEEGWIN